MLRENICVTIIDSAASSPAPILDTTLLADTHDVACAAVLPTRDRGLDPTRDSPDADSSVTLIDPVWATFVTTELLTSPP